MESSSDINDAISQRLLALSDLVDAYNPWLSHFFAAVILAVIAISVIVIHAVGLLVGVLLLGLVVAGYAFIETNGLLNFKRIPSDEEYSERACQLMNSCINLYKYPGDDPVSEMHRMFLSYSRDGNLSLYKEFISIFPHMASKKLRKLASIKLGNRIHS